MKKTIYTAILAAAALLASSCSDFLDKKSSAYDSDGFYKSEAGLNEGLTAVYRQLIYDQNWGVAAPQMQDVYCPYGLQNEENNTITWLRIGTVTLQPLAVPITAYQALQSISTR